MHFYVTFGCDFVRGSNGQKMGIWYVDDGSGTCIEWDEAMEDKYVSGSRSSLTIATVAGFGAAVLVLFEWLLCEVCCAGCIEGLAFCCAWIVGGAVFTIYGKEYICIYRQMCISTKMRCCMGSILLFCIRGWFLIVCGHRQ